MVHAVQCTSTNSGQPQIIKRNLAEAMGWYMICTPGNTNDPDALEVRNLRVDMRDDFHRGVCS